MPTFSSSRICTAQNTRSSAQHEQKERPTDQRELQLLEDHRPWEMLDDTVLTIINQTYAALLGILGLAGPPEGGRPVKVRQLVDATDPDSPASPMLCVVEASARHCCISLIDGIGGWWEPEYTRYISLTQRRQQNRRASVSTSPGTVHLSRAEGGGGQEDHSCKCADDDRPNVVSEKGLLEVLDTMRSHLDNAIQVESSMIRMARTSERHNKLRESFMVRKALEGIRREVDLGAIMRRRCAYRRHHRAREISRRRPAAEMDVDQVDEAEVLTKRLKAMHL